MDADRIAPGLVGTLQTEVTEQNSTARGSVRVYATPSMIALMESSAHAAVAPHLAANENTVGIHVDVRHLAPSLLGTQVQAKATLVDVEGRKLTFQIEAFDAVERVGEGTHQRFIIDTDRYQQRLDRKRQTLDEQPSA